MAQRALFWTNPHWPAGHLPLEGGETRRLRPCLSGSREWRDALRQPLSPLEGEMAFRPEGVVDDFAEVASC
jgi:assimilatory nitrate reductase catalytic subunit